MIRFELPISGRAVRLHSLIVWLKIALYGYIHVGREGKTDWYAFKCATCKALKLDTKHGYVSWSPSGMYLRCHDCGYEQGV